MKKLALVLSLAFVACATLADLKNGTAFTLQDVPKEIVVQRRAGEPLRFSVEENATTGYRWEAEWNTNECAFVMDRRCRSGGGLVAERDAGGGVRCAVCGCRGGT